MDDSINRSALARSCSLLQETTRISLSKYHKWVEIHQLSHSGIATTNDYMQQIMKPKAIARTGSNQCVLECN